jgi:hypothetical protein
MLSTPWSLGFVLAVILGAMLVPGCRPQDGPLGPSRRSSGLTAQFGSSQIIVEVADRPESRPAAPYPIESVGRRRP